MGKNGEQNLEGRRGLEVGNPYPSRFFCARCSRVLSRVSKEFSFRCVFVLILSLSILLTGIFWIFPLHTWKLGYDAKEAIKQSATVQSYFRLQMPVSELVPQIERIEYDIYEEIGLPNTKVTILSMRQSSASNWTDVVFGVLSDPIDVPINSVSLSVLRSSLIELFLQQSNLTLTTAISGQPYKFEILKFPGGITVIPVQSASIWQIPQIMFNFTLNNSISEIEEKFLALKNQLKYGLRLTPYENIFLQITNKNGSTVSPPVIVQASILSDMGSILPQRLKLLARMITNSPAGNLGLDNSVFGKVNSIILSSYRKDTLHGNAPTPSPAPSPSPLISPSPASSPAPSPHGHHNTHASPSSHTRHYAPNPKNSPHHSMPPIQNSVAPSSANADPPCRYSRPTLHPRSSRISPTMGPQLALPPDLPPLPAVTCGSHPGKDARTSKGPVSLPLGPSPLAQSFSSLAVGILTREVWLLGFSGMLIFHLLCWSY
ncbi:hypothetical protein SLEP1_g33879 [Rubroshorea leprosula]|uniref:DUF7036 domain-containing protein n=1 Tax=Rubroshorea leprosula TaxID=152421 RepID=A0AAV5KI02_9ROSI|nr:hypothetical protein SLEP1_g33879 [Rubroshorea leprosula]